MESARCKAFIKSAELGSFSRAGEALSYSPSGVSQLVTALEAEFGFPLLHRTKKGVTLTEAGEKLLPAVRTFIQQEERMFQLAAEVKGLDVGQITIASYYSISNHWLPKVISAFEKDHPHIRIRLMEGIRKDVIGALRDASADIGFMSSGGGLGFDWLPLAEDPMLAVLPRAHPAAARESFPVEDFSKESFIMPAFGHDDDVTALFERFRIEPNIKFSTLESFAAMSMVESGLGISVMNRLITVNWQCDVALLPLDPPQSITLGMALPSLAQAAPAVRKFAEYTVRMLVRRELPGQGE